MATSALEVSRSADRKSELRSPTYEGPGSGRHRPPSALTSSRSFSAARRGTSVISNLSPCGIDVIEYSSEPARHGARRMNLTPFPGRARRPTRNA
jgi:hypothetical protein